MRVDCQPVVKVFRSGQSAAYTRKPMAAGYGGRKAPKSGPGCQAGLVDDTTTKAPNGLL